MRERPGVYLSTEPPLEKVKETGKIKECPKCKTIKPIVAFYRNKKWKAQMNRDSWCCDCVKKTIVDKHTLMEYCHYNNRVFQEQLYSELSLRAAKELAVDQKYLRMDYAKKNQRLFEVIKKYYFEVWQHAEYYEYVETSGTPMVDPHEYERAVRNKEISEEEQRMNEIVYDNFWRGRYSRSDIEYLNDYYENLLSTEPDMTFSRKDYAKKIAVASLNVERAAKTAHLDGGKEYQAMLKVFDSLNSSAAFSETKRKATDSIGVTTFGEMIQKIENSGHEIVSSVEFPEDDIDKIMRDLQHVLEAVGAQGGLPDASDI